MAEEKNEFVSWSGQRFQIEGFWAPEKGEKVQGVLIQRNRNKGGKVATPFYVLQLTKPCDKVKLQDKVMKKDKGTMIAVPENSSLEGLDELLGFEVMLTLTDVRPWQFVSEDGEVEDRTIKEFSIKHSAEVVNKAAASRYRPQAAPAR